MNTPDHTEQYRLRPATADDVPTILMFIQELAEYERLAHEVEADETKLRDTLFGAHPAAEVIIAEALLSSPGNDQVDGGEPMAAPPSSRSDVVLPSIMQPVGFALYFFNYSTYLARRGLYLEDLYITPAARGRGIGLALMKQLARIARERDCGRFEWSVLDWNEPSIRFYRQLGAVPMDDWTVFRASGEALQKLAESP